WSARSSSTPAAGGTLSRRQGGTGWSGWTRQRRSSVGSSAKQRLQGVDIAQGADEPPRAFVRPRLRRAVPRTLGCPQGTQAFALAARFGRLLVERLGHLRRPAAIAQPEHRDVEQLIAAADPQGIPDAHGTRRLRALPTHLDLAVLDRVARQAARLEEPRRPEPQVQAHRAGGFDGRSRCHRTIVEKPGGSGLNRDDAAAAGPTPQHPKRKRPPGGGRCCASRGADYSAAAASAFALA